MKQAISVESLALHFEDWVWDLTAPELEQMHRELALGMHQGRAELDRVLAENADETLALAVQKGFFRAAAFRELFHNRYERRLLAWFDRWGTEANAAFDLTQDLFLRFHKIKLKDYQPSKSFCSYLRTAAYNHWVSKECRGRRPVLADDLHRHRSPADVADEVERREGERRLREALAKLPEDLRVVLELEFEDVAAEEIARRLGTTVKRVYGRTHRAKRRLAALLGLVPPPSNSGRKPKDRPVPKAPPFQP